MPRRSEGGVDEDAHEKENIVLLCRYHVWLGIGEPVQSDKYLEESYVQNMFENEEAMTDDTKAGKYIEGKNAIIYTREFKNPYQVYCVCGHQVMIHGADGSGCSTCKSSENNLHVIKVRK